MATQTKIKRTPIVWSLVTSGVIGNQLGVSRSMLRRWRVDDRITEGIHWQYQPGTKSRILWNLDLMRDWVANGGDCPAHQRAIELYASSLPSARSR